MRVLAQANGFGACITGIDLSKAMDVHTEKSIRAAWIKHRVLCFPDQRISVGQLEAFSARFGPFGREPYVAPIKGHPNVIEVRREAREGSSPFGSSWHSDWSFLPQPPSATILHARELPPYGGDTLFADGYAAYAALDPETQNTLDGLTAVHSARRPYSHEGYQAGGGGSRSMDIRPSDDAYRTQLHPLVRTHPESGRKALWLNRVYTIAIQGMAREQGEALISQLCDHAEDARFVYRHRWTDDMVTMWDNRCVQHCAQGGYDGHRRVMLRTTIAGDRPR